MNSACTNMAAAKKYAYFSSPRIRISTIWKSFFSSMNSARANQAATEIIRVELLAAKKGS